jgi:hypothetical protein
MTKFDYAAHSIKQIADADGEAMMEVVVNSDCSAADMGAIHANALEFNNAYNTLYVYAPGDAAREVWDQMTPIEQTVSVELRHAEALEMNLFEDRIAAAGMLMFKHGEKCPIAACHTEALDLNAEIDDGKTMDMYHKWNTAPTAQIRRDMLAAAHEEALAMNTARNLKSPQAFSAVKHFGAHQVIQNHDRVISTRRVAVLGSIEAARDQACEIRDACAEDSPDDHFHVRYVPFYLFAGAPFRPVII